MGYRFVIWISLAVGCWGQERLSDWYVESVRGIMDWEPRDAARMEAALRKDPRDLRARLQLMAYSTRADQAQEVGSLVSRVGHVLWLVENAPESEILRSPYARVSRAELSEAQIRKFVALWGRAKGDDAAIAWNASLFFSQIDADEYWKYLAQTVRLAPGNAMAIRQLADLCAKGIGEGGAKRVRAEKVLAESSNPWLLGNTAHQMHLRGVGGADGYFLRAKMIEPSMRQEQIFPTAKPVAPEKRMRNGEVGRLAVREFSELPETIADLLEGRGCKIPQNYGEKTKHNLVRGEFISKGEVSWAVLCSVRGKSSILVFRNREDSRPQELASAEDVHYMQGMGGDTYEFSRKIKAVDARYIERHYRAYGGPKPPLMDHQGIDDAFVGKASSVWYFAGGKWMRLQGAD